MKRRTFFQRLAAACALPWVKMPPVKVYRTTGAAAFVLPMETIETAFGTVQIFTASKERLEFWKQTETKQTP